jgi:hypothetical protein
VFLWVLGWNYLVKLWKLCDSATFIFVLKFTEGSQIAKRSFEGHSEIIVFEVIRRKGQILTKKMF